MPTPTLVPPKNNQCFACHGTGHVHAGSKHDPEYDPETCLECGGTGQQTIDADRDACPQCGKGELRYIAITSREPHGETFTDEGWKCLACGATIMDTAERPSRTSSDLIGDLMRSLCLAKNLDPAFRMGVALAPKRRRVAKDVA